MTRSAGAGDTFPHISNPNKRLDFGEVPITARTIDDLVAMDPTLYVADTHINVKA